MVGEWSSRILDAFCGVFGGRIWEIMGWDSYCGGDVDIWLIVVVVVVVVGTFI